MSAILDAVTSSVAATRRRPVDVDSTTQRREALISLVHAGIVAWFVGELAYVGWLLFVVLNPAGVGPLGASAATISHELMVTRRLYAIEAWIAFGGLALYLAATEIIPRRRR